MVQTSQLNEAQNFSEHNVISTPFRVLNLYAGIGGNRKLWSGNIHVTAVEYDPSIAAIYADLNPDDTVIVGDAHQYLIDHYKEFDFIWASPPCPTHSQTNHFLNAQGVIRYPDMALYQEIIFLQHFYQGKYCIENVVSYYEPLIKPQISGRHYFWANFKIPHGLDSVKMGRMGKLKNGEHGEKNRMLDEFGFDLSKYQNVDKRHVLRNCVTPEIGLAIFQSALNIYDSNKANQIGLFSSSF